MCSLSTITTMLAQQIDKLGQASKIRYLQLLGHDVELDKDMYQGAYFNRHRQRFSCKSMATV